MKATSISPSSDEDIVWAAKSLGLAATAFSAAGVGDARSVVLKATGSLDVESCPGSGKTTLVVAKLALLAKQWVETGRGICVLSHTNAAREEIERVLTFEPSARRLMGYPHFIGTIHSFANEFLALPAMRTKGFKSVVMDDALCEAHRRKLLKRSQYTALRNWLGHQEKNDANIVGRWRISSVACGLTKGDGSPVFANESSPSAKQLNQLGQACASDGYYCFSESFVWANHLMGLHPPIISALRRRFPIVFIDEAQDNDADQTAFIHRLFTEGAEPSVLQRFGDSNQAIYNSDEDGDAAAANSFPNATKVSIPNSYRFAQPIADLADPLGIVPYGLQGLGPKPAIAAKPDQNVIFLFTEKSGQYVLDAYCRHLLTVFSAEEIERGRFHAVGSRHKSSDATNYPRSVGNYWDAYDWQTPLASPKPTTFYQYVSLARSLASSTGEGGSAVKLLCEGLMHLARVMDVTFHDRPRARLVRYLDERMADFPDGQARFRSFLVAFGVDRKEPTDAEWNSGLRAIAARLARDVANYSGPEPSAVSAFLSWPAPAGTTQTAKKKSSNIFSFPDSHPQVEVNVGSIHSVKGQTHTATLVLETFFHGHHLKGLMPWLLGEKSGGTGEGARQRMRLKTHYVAMTRPTHVLCLAMLDDMAAEHMNALKARGWRLARVGEQAEAWL